MSLYFRLKSSMVLKALDYRAVDTVLNINQLFESYEYVLLKVAVIGKSAHRLLIKVGVPWLCRGFMSPCTVWGVSVRT